MTSAWQPGTASDGEAPSLAAVRARATTTRDVANLYELYRGAGLGYSGPFRSLAACWVGDNVALGRIELDRGSTTGYVQHPVWLDAALQLIGVALAERKAAGLLLPTGCDAIRDRSPLNGSVAWGVAELGDADEADLYLYTEDGTLAGDVKRLRLRALSLASFFPDRPAAADEGDRAGGAIVSSAVTRARSLPPTEQAVALVDIVRAEVIHALKLSSEWRDVETSLYHHGLDSLLAVELRNRFRFALEVDIPVLEFMDQSSVRTLAASVQAQWQLAGAAVSSFDAEPGTDDREEGEL